MLVDIIMHWISTEPSLSSGDSVVTFDPNCPVEISSFDDPICEQVTESSTAPTSTSTASPSSTSNVPAVATSLIVGIAILVITFVVMTVIMIWAKKNDR